MKSLSKHKLPLLIFIDPNKRAGKYFPLEGGIGSQEISGEEKEEGSTRNIV